VFPVRALALFLFLDHAPYALDLVPEAFQLVPHGALHLFASIFVTPRAVSSILQSFELVSQLLELAPELLLTP